MKKLLLVSAATLFLGVFVALNVSAQDAQPVITDEKVQNIRDRCIENQAALRRLHQTDAVLRTNRGDLYRTISDKLMTPLNKRLVANQLDGGELVDLAAGFSSQYDDFFDAYFDYDNALSNVLRIDCDREPVTFYTALLDARAKRAELNKTNAKLMETIRQYSTAFADFRAGYEKENP